MINIKRIKITLSLFVLFSIQFSLTHVTFASIEEEKKKESLLDPGIKDTNLDAGQMEADLTNIVEFSPTQSRTIDTGKEGFYKTFKSEIDDLIKQYENLYGEGSADSYNERIKNFDYHKAEFDCGKLDVGCNIDSWIISIGKQATEYVLAPLSKLAIKPSEVLDNTVIKQFRESFGNLPQVLLSLILIYQILKIIVVRFTDMGDAPQVLNEKLVKVLIAGFLLFTYDYFFKLLLDLQYALNAPIFYQLSGSSSFSTDIIVAFLLTPNGAMMIVFLIIFALIILALFLQMVYSFCLISVLYVTGPLAFVTLPNDEYNLFTIWLKIFVSRAITLFLQGLAVLLSISTLTNFDNVLSLSKQPFTFAISIGFLIVGVMIPSLLQNFGSSSGSGRMVITSIKTISHGLGRK